MNAIKAGFGNIASADFLKKCVHGKIQNPNEILNSVIWTELYRVKWT
jgi:hypothetical protein